MKLESPSTGRRTRVARGCDFNFIGKLFVAAHAFAIVRVASRVQYRRAITWRACANWLTEEGGERVRIRAADSPRCARSRTRNKKGKEKKFDRASHAVSRPLLRFHFQAYAREIRARSFSVKTRRAIPTLSADRTTARRRRTTTRGRGRCIRRVTTPAERFAHRELPRARYDGSAWRRERNGAVSGPAGVSSFRARELRLTQTGKKVG